MPSANIWLGFDFLFLLLVQVLMHFAEFNEARRPTEESTSQEEKGDKEHIHTYTVWFGINQKSP